MSSFVEQEATLASELKQQKPYLNDSVLVAVAVPGEDLHLLREEYKIAPWIKG
jgi:hypothetical protein